MANEEIRAAVRKNYGGIATQQQTGCGCGCSCESDTKDLRTIAEQLGYSEADLAAIPEHANLGLGCGNPLALLTLAEGQTVLDLGSGGGFDCFLARAKVGETGLVIGVDMTSEMIDLARRNAAQKGYTNVQFRLGEIEHLPVADNSVDVIISNCVVNLSPDKASVFKDAYRVLRTGGKLCISDVVATGEIPVDVREDLNLVSCCIGGAASVEEVERLLEDAGFVDIRMSAKENSDAVISSWQMGEQAASFVASYIIEAHKS